MPVAKQTYVNHKFPACPISCELFKDDFGMPDRYPFMMPDDLIYTWTADLPQPQIEFFAEDKFLHNSVLTYEIKCTISPSAVENTAVNQFTVEIKDECFNTQISPLPSAESYEIPLYFPHDQLFSPAGQTKLSCEMPIYSINIVSSTAMVDADF